MLFLVKFDYCQPSTMNDEEWGQVMAREGEHGNDGIRQGKLKELYLAAGTNTAFCLYDVNDAGELHQMVSTLPLFRYSQITMYPLIDLGEIKRRNMR